ncbi:hypothetical protein OAU99_01495 [Candidatus Poseidoniaceae archaeon]|nr:hypothetical protein [Candidatus Poseidoniaceae archaeon]
MTTYNMTTIPATEENLTLEEDVHPFDADLPKTVEFKLHPVIVDGILGEACVGTLGAYSQRIRINLAEEHPELGSDFQTKYYIFTEPGKVTWGHYGASFTIEKII